MKYLKVFLSLVLLLSINFLMLYIYHNSVSEKPDCLMSRKQKQPAMKKDILNVQCCIHDDFIRGH